jgi:hypothetical protein
MQAATDATPDPTTGGAGSRAGRGVFVAAAVVVAALAAGGAAYAATTGDPSGDTGDAGYVVVDQSGTGGRGALPAQGGTGADCPRGTEQAPQPSGAADQL